jgi:addiction module HigA family antidote
MAKRKVAPGETIAAMMADFRLSVKELAEGVGLSQPIVRHILADKTKITLPVALRLAKIFGINFKDLVDLQMECDLANLKADKSFQSDLQNIKKAKKPTAAQIAREEKEKAAPAPKAKRRRKPKQEAADVSDASDAAPKAKRGRKPKQETADVYNASDAAPKAKRGRKPKQAASEVSDASDAAPRAKRGRKPKIKSDDEVPVAKVRRPRGRRVKAVTEPEPEPVETKPNSILIKRQRPAPQIDPQMEDETEEQIEDRFESQAEEDIAVSEEDIADSTEENAGLFDFSSSSDSETSDGED